VLNETTLHPHRIFFVAGEPYRLLGPYPGEPAISSVPLNPTQPFYLFGSDRIGRDVFRRLIYGPRAFPPRLASSVSPRALVVFGGAARR